MASKDSSGANVNDDKDGGKNEKSNQPKDSSSSSPTKKAKNVSSPLTGDETASPYPAMDLCQDIHRLTSARDRSSLVSLESRVFDRIYSELENPSLYQWLQNELYQGRTSLISTAKMTESELKALTEKNAQKLQELEDKVAQAKESAGDMEVMEARLAIARFAAKSLDYQQAMQAYQDLLALPKLGSGKQIDAWMDAARVASFYRDTVKADECIDKANKLANDPNSGGGDWDRRNRLKVYRALQSLLHRNTQQASKLLLDCIATFSCNEICNYTDFLVYAILSNLLHLPRPELKKKIIDGPEILSVAPEIPTVIKLVRSFYDCDYRAYLHAMVEVESVLQSDRYLQPHVAYWMRELHILAYQQFLDSYQSVTLDAMATAFGVSTEFIDLHASRLIAANRLTAKIDKYGGVIVTNRPDKKNAQYRDMIQKGDLLLNRIQKLARVVDL